MEIPDYPSNKFDSREPQDKENIKRITSDDPIRKKKGLRKQFHDTLIAGNPRGALNYVVLEVLLPAAKDMISEAGASYLDKLVYGESSRRRRAVSPPQSGPTGYVSYNQYSMAQSSPQRALSRRARAQHDFDEIILQHRGEADDVIDRMYEIMSRYGVVSVSDLYELVGIKSSYTDNSWGWKGLRGAGVTRVRDGWLIDLPSPQPLD
jgi:hypothetical protein